MARPLEGSRLLGVILLIVGLGLSYFEIVQPLQEAAQGARRVTWNDNWPFMGLFLSLLGLVAAIFPKILCARSFRFIGKGKLRIYGWLLIGALSRTRLRSVRSSTTRLPSLAINRPRLGELLGLRSKSQAQPQTA